VPYAPAGVVWIDWVLLVFSACGAECDDALRLYASRGLSVLIAQFEALKRHLANTVGLLSSLALNSPRELTGTNGRSHFEHTLKVLMKAQRAWLDFLTGRQRSR